MRKQLLAEIETGQPSLEEVRDNILTSSRRSDATRCVRDGGSSAGPIFRGSRGISSAAAARR